MTARRYGGGGTARRDGRVVSRAPGIRDGSGKHAVQRRARSVGNERSRGAVVLFNKPYGVVCQFSPHPARPTLKQYVPVEHVYPAGRLDWDSEGLVVLTADGGLQHRISDPQMKMQKTYWVQVERVPDETALGQLRNGVDLGDFVTLPADVRPMHEPAPLWPRQPPIRARRAIPTAWLELTLCEGKNRQVRRMTAAVGHPTLRLIRWRVGPWDLQDLAPGQYRYSSAGRP